MPGAWFHLRARGQVSREENVTEAGRWEGLGVWPAAWAGSGKYAEDRGGAGPLGSIVSGDSHPAELDHGAWPGRNQDLSRRGPEVLGPLRVGLRRRAQGRTSSSVCLGTGLAG